MQVVVLASQKGGSGKTTLSGHLAVEAEARGAGPVVLIDTDPQGSLSDWWNARASETPAFARVAIDELGACLSELREMGVKLAVIDTPPAITQSIASVVAHADLVIIPARPSPHDLRAVGATIDIVEHLQKPLVFVINAATARAKITGESAVALSQHGTVAPVTLHHRVDFAASMVDGKTIGEIDAKSKSAREVSALWDYMAGRLARLKGVVSDAPRVETKLDALSPLATVAARAEPVVEAPVQEVIVAEALVETMEVVQEPEVEAEVEAEIEAEEVDVSLAIRDGASVRFAYDPAEGLDDAPLRPMFAAVPVPAWAPPPQPQPRPSPPPMHSARDVAPLPDKRLGVFGRRGAERVSTQGSEKSR